MLSKCITIKLKKKIERKSLSGSCFVRKPDWALKRVYIAHFRDAVFFSFPPHFICFAMASHYVGLVLYEYKASKSKRISLAVGGTQKSRLKNTLNMNSCLFFNFNPCFTLLAIVSKFMNSFPYTKLYFFFRAFLFFLF